MPLDYPMAKWAPVGHMHLGAGKVVWQDLPRISQAIEKLELPSNSNLIDLMDFCLRHKKPLHLMGLLSDGGVHAHIDHASVWSTRRLLRTR